MLYISIILQGSQNLIVQWVPLIFIIFVVYFLMIRPQAKKAKAQNEFLANLQKGDRIATGSGIVGKITKLDGKITQIQVDGKTYLDIVTTTISKEMTEFLDAEKA